MKKNYNYQLLKNTLIKAVFLMGVLLWGSNSLNAQTYNLPITGTDAVRCGAGELSLAVTWSGTALDINKVKWYTVPFYGTPIATGLTYSTGYIEQTKTFYVDYIGDGGCSQCNRLLVRAVINDNAIDPQISYSSLKVCNNIDQNFTPTIVGASNGTFAVSPSSGLAVNSSTGVFNPQGATLGSYTITFTPVQVIGCNSAPVSTGVTITQALVDPVISYPLASYCSSASAVSVTRSAGASDGTYTAYPTGLSINATSGEITPASSITGNYTVSYTVPGNGGCTPVVGTATVSILKLPTAAISYTASSYTQNQGSQLVTLTGTDDYMGGIFSAGAGLTIDASTGTIAPATSTAGTYTVTYTKTAVSPCADNLVATTSVTIFGMSTASLAVNVSQICQNSTEPVLTFTGSGGTAPYTFNYTINNGGSLDVASANGSTTVTVNHPTLVAGTYTYRITGVTDANGSNQTFSSGAEPNVIITVTSPQLATLEYSGSPYCSNDSDPSPTFLAGGVAGTFSSTAGLVFADDATGVIDISASTPGTYNITNTIASAGGCSVVTANASVTIAPLPLAGFSYANASYCQLDTDPIVTLATGAEHGIYTSNPIGVVFLADGGINLDESAPNSYTIYNTVSAADGCVQVQESTTITITPEIVISSPIFNAGLTTSRCQAAEILNIYGATSTGSNNITYSYALDAASLTGGNTIDAATGAVTWVGTWSGTTEITVTASATCAQPKTAIHTVTTNQSGALDTPTFTFGATSTRCQGAENIAYTLSNVNANFNYTYILDDTSIAGGNVSFSFQNDITWSPDWYGVSTLKVKASSGCSSSPEATITITTNPVPAIPTATDVTVTYDGQSHTGSASSTVPLIAGGSQAANIIWYDAATGGNEISAPSGTNVGTYTAYAQAVAPTTGCISTARTLVTVTINQRPLTANSTIWDKTYDGLATTGTVNLGTVSNLVGTESLTITPSAENFTDANVADGKTTTISYSLSNGTGGLATNYSMAGISATGDINSLLLTIADPTLTTSKVYDGTTTAVVTAGSFTNKVGSDDVTVNAGANYDDSNVGTGKTITVVYTITGAAAGNYTKPVDYSINTGEITAKVLSITSPVIASKVYDRTTTAGAVTTGTLSGFVSSETVTATAVAEAYNSANVGTYNNVVVNYTLLNGANGGLATNYSLASGSATGTITQANLAVTAVTDSKTYDGSVTSSQIPTVGTLISGDIINVQPTQVYDNKNVGTTHVMTPSGLTIKDGSNNDMTGNYNITYITVNAGVITTKSLSISSPAIASKVYDRTTTAGVITIGTLSGFVSSETVTATAVAAAYTSANAGTYNNVAITYTLTDGTNGGLATNYSLADGTATGVVTAAPLSITSPSIASKVYDGTTTAGAVTVGTLSGFAGTETVTATAVAAVYSSANVGTYNDVVVTYTLVNGANGGLATNYSLDSGSATGTITAATLTITASDGFKGYGETLSSTTTGSTAFTVGAGQLMSVDDVSSVTITYLNSVETAAKAVGTYTSTIEPAAAQGTGLSNYSITYAKGSMTIYEVIVVATEGTSLKAGYNTIKAAYDAINAGTHKGAIEVKVYANTTETNTATLNDSGVGSANYTSVTIHAMAGVTISGSASPVMILGQEAANP